MALQEVRQWLEPGCGYGCYWCTGRGPDNPFIADPAPLARCPTQEYFKFASYAARGRFWLAMGMYQGEVPLAEDLVKPLYTCLACGVCDELCMIYPGKVVDIIRHAREELREHEVAPPPACQKVDQDLSRTFNAFGSPQANRTKWAEGLPLAAKGEDLYFVGCYTSWRYPTIAQAVVRVLYGAGVKLAYLGEQERCCGLHSFWDGSRHIAAELAKHNVRAIEAAGARRVIFSCANCYRTFKVDYPTLLGIPLPFQVLHVSQVLAELLSDGRLHFQQPIAQTITYHDPCQLARYTRVLDEPRQVLSAIPGIKLSEMEHSGRFSWCCGDGCLVVSTAYPEFSQWTAAQRLRQASEVAQHLVTTCPHCYESLSRAQRREGAPLGITDLSVLVAQALGL